MQWVGDHDHVREDFSRHFPTSSSTKHRLSRSRPRPHNQGSDSESASAIKDQVVFTESPVMPGVPMVFRSPEEKAMSVERLNLDRRHLLVCPILEGEERLRLLNLQHNSISRLQHLNGLRRLVFLDLYDNLVHEISGLEGLVSLRVLMLGRNRCVRWEVGLVGEWHSNYLCISRIRKISGLQTLIKLDVLDLHGNMVS